jgi:hypothetical protein
MFELFDSYPGLLPVVIFLGRIIEDIRARQKGIFKAPSSAGLQRLGK